MFWASSSEDDSGSEAEDLFAVWTDVIRDDFSDSTASGDEDEKVKRMEVIEHDHEACEAEYLVIELKRTQGNLLVGWKSKDSAQSVVESTMLENARSTIADNEHAERIRNIASRSRHIRIAVPLPTRMLNTRAIAPDSSDPPTLEVRLPRPPGSSSVSDTSIVISCRCVEEIEEEEAPPSYGVHLRWTVANPSGVGFAPDNTYSLQKILNNPPSFRESYVGMNAFSMMFRCSEIVSQAGGKSDDSPPLPKKLLVDLSPSRLCVYDEDYEEWKHKRSLASPRKKGHASGTEMKEETFEEEGEISVVPTSLTASISAKRKVPVRQEMKIPSADDDDDFEESDEEEPEVVNSIPVDMTNFLRSDESPFGYSISIDVYENQFMLVPRAGSKQRGIALRGQKWMPLGARSSLSSRSSITHASSTPNDAPVYHTFSDVSGEMEFPTYASLVPSADSEGLTAKTHSISEDVIEMEGFEVSSEWALVKAFGSKITGYETRIEVQEEENEDDDYDDLGDDDGECWWYAATLENLLTNTACYQSYYPGCLYRRRCWRKYLRHKVCSLLRFKDLHRKMKPHDPSVHTQATCNVKPAVKEATSEFQADLDEPHSWEWNWADVTDCCVLSNAAVAFTVKMDKSDNFGRFESKSFVISPCYAKRVVDIINLRRQLAEARTLIERNVIPVIRSGRNLFHSNRIDSCGYISIVSDVSQDVLDQKAIAYTMTKLREIIQNATVALIPELHKRCRPTKVEMKNNLISGDLKTFLSTAEIEDLSPLQPVPMLLTLPDSSESEKVCPHTDLVFLVLERLVGYYRLLSGYTKQGSAISKTPLKFSLAPSILLKTTSNVTGYVPNTNFMKDRAPSIAVSEVNRGTMWKLQDDEDITDELVIETMFFRPEYNVRDTLSYVNKLMQTAVDGILCTQKAAVASGDADLRTQRYLETLCEYANNCVCKIVSVIRSIVAWNPPDQQISSKSGPWDDGFLPLTTFIVRNNPRLLLTLLAVTTTAPFSVKKVPCFSRYTGIRSLIHWELHPRARSLYMWVKSLKNGGLKYILETRCFYYGDRVRDMYLGKEEASEDEDKEPFTSVPDGFQHALRECMLNGYLEMCALYYEVDYSDVVPVSKKSLEKTEEENYSGLLMEDKGFSVTAMSRLHNLVTHTAVQCFSMLLNEYMMLLKDLKSHKKSDRQRSLLSKIQNFEFHPMIRIPSAAKKRPTLSRSSLYLGQDSSQELVDPDFCIMSAVAADCLQFQIFVEEFSTVSFPFFFDHLVKSLEMKDSAPIRKLLIDIDDIHRQLDRLQADFGRLHKRALHEQSRFIFRYCRPFELSIMKSTDDQPAALVKSTSQKVHRFSSLDSDDDMPESNAAATNSEALPAISENEDESSELQQEKTEGIDNSPHTEPADIGVALESTPESVALTFNKEDFSAKLGFLCRIIYLLSGKDSYDTFVEHGFRAIAAPMLNAIRGIHEHVESREGEWDEALLGRSPQICTELQGELMEVYCQISNMLAPSWKPPRVSSSVIRRRYAEAPVITSMFAESEGEPSSSSNSRYVRMKFKSLDRNLFAVLCAIETTLTKRKQGEDKAFLESIASIDEFQTPLLSEEVASKKDTLIDDHDLDSSTMGKYKETRRIVLDRKTKKVSASHYSEFIEVSNLAVRGIPCVVRRSPDEPEAEGENGDIAENTGDRQDGAEATESPVQKDSKDGDKVQRAQKRVGSCYLVIKCITRSGKQKNIFQTKGASEGDRNPIWSDHFVSDSQRCSDLLPGGPDPIECLEVELYDRIAITPPSLLFSGTFETLLLGKTSIPLELVRLQSIKHWFTIEPSDMICPTDYWRVSLFLEVRLNTTSAKS